MDVKEFNGRRLEMNRNRFKMKLFHESIPKEPGIELLPQTKKTKRAPAKPYQNKIIQQTNKKKPYKKEKISAALREQVWVQHNGQVFKSKCNVTWCHNQITVFDFQCGHDIPESKGGPTNITNLYPICGKCNLSMSNTYTFKEWCKLYEAKPDSKMNEQAPVEEVPRPRSFWKRLLCYCFH